MEEKRNRMRRRFQRTTRTAAFLLSATLPALEAGLFVCCGYSAHAQAADTKPADTTTQNNQDATKPAPPAATSKIGSITVVGNKTLSETYIVAASGHKIGDPCTDQTLFEMKNNLTRTGDFGQHSADPEEWVRVRAEEANPPNGTCKVFIEVDENDTVKGVQITGSGPIKPERIRTLLHFTENRSVYNENQFLRDTTDIQEIYARDGYIAVPGQDAGMDPNQPGILRVPIVVARVGEIKFAKNHKTRRYVLLREMKTKEGDYYNRKTISRDLNRLYNLDLFEDVSLAENDLGAGRIGLTISVPEKRTGIVSAGVGFSNRQQLIGRAEITETNFRGTGQQLNLVWETGGAVNRNSVTLGFTEPWLDRRHTALNVQLYDRTIYRFANSLSNSVASTELVGTDNRYNEQRTGGVVTLSRPFHDTYGASLSFRGENVRADRLDLSLVNARIIQNGPIYSVTTSLFHNSRDRDLDPVTGNFQTYSLQAGHADLQPLYALDGTLVPGIYGSANFLKGSMEFREYLPLRGARKPNKMDEDKPALAMRLVLGSSAGTLPFFEQFFVGGAESLRGYREDRFWGNNYLLGSVELRQPIARKVKGVLFIDAGDAWGGPYSDVQISGFDQSGFSLHIGTGVGLRVGTPIGPLRLDFGIGSEGTRFHFSFGNVF